MKLIPPLLVFGLFNFGGLAVGSLFTRSGVTSHWYQSLAKAPWTPPGWVFGLAWFVIMICFTIYLAKLWQVVGSNKALIMFTAALILNIAWNPVFFGWHQLLLGLIILITLLTVIALFWFNFRLELKSLSWLLLPYTLWLLVAISLNGYILANN